MIQKIPTYFGVARKSLATAVSDKDGSLTLALIERRKWKRKWWHPKNLRLDGYQDPWKD